MCKNVEFKQNITKIEKLSIKKSKIQFVEVKWLIKENSFS